MSFTATMVESQQLHGPSLRKIAGVVHGRPCGMRGHHRREHVAKGGGVCFANHFKKWATFAARSACARTTGSAEQLTWTSSPSLTVQSLKMTL